MDSYYILWLGWLALFLTIEIPALLDARKGGTFSEAVWWFLGVGKRRTNLVQARRIIGLSFGGWLLVHFVSGGWV
ncbi:MAG: hypothetical protein M3440_04715 [Chloroflexota bacterium]|nr:hypothetical protein [Chloroflexota bacterium]